MNNNAPNTLLGGESAVHYEWLDVFKGWGIIFIIVGHIAGAAYHLSTGNSQAFCESLFKYLYNFHVPLFFFVAGLTIKKHLWSKFLNRTLMRLLVPYLLIGLFSIILYSSAQHFINNEFNANSTTNYYIYKAGGTGIIEQLICLLLGGWGKIGFVANSPLWFIPALITCELLYQILCRKVSILSHIIICLIFFIFESMQIPLELPFGISLLPKYYPFLFIGHLLGVYRINNAKILFKWICLPMGIVVGYFSLINPYQYFPTGLLTSIQNEVLIIGSILVWLGISFLSANSFFALLGRYSLGLMLLHKFVVVFFQNLLSPLRNLFSFNISTTIFAIFLLTSLTIGATLLACVIIEHFAPFIIGMKHQKK